MITSPTRIYALQPPSFQVMIDTKDWEAMISFSQQYQMTDTFFHDVMDFVEIASLVPASCRDDRLMWMDHTALRDMIRFAKESHEFQQGLQQFRIEPEPKLQTKGNCCDCIIC